MIWTGSDTFKQIPNSTSFVFDIIWMISTDWFISFYINQIIRNWRIQVSFWLVLAVLRLEKLCAAKLLRFHWQIEEELIFVFLDLVLDLLLFQYLRGIAENYKYNQG